ncbi:HIT domain-containing protein [Candidatus Dependentiae bacterium]|nr:HIT domain-containing protein [Candidatus Dependentiae bacterium]
MNSQDCIFCKIIKKEVPSKIIKETENVLVIEDISPKAPIHYLILPKKHIRNLHYLQREDSKLSYEILAIAKKLAHEIQQEKSLEKPVAFNFLINNEEQAGQSVFHLHAHFISGKNIFVDGSTL